MVTFLGYGYDTRFPPKRLADPPKYCGGRCWVTLFVLKNIFVTILFNNALIFNAFYLIT